MKIDELKKKAAEQAVEYVKSGMVVGLGTGSTTKFAILKIPSPKLFYIMPYYWQRYH
jgi:ribose 5-phosphate isomerase